MIKFTSGDMFETNADIRINTVNCVGVMGAGVALAFKNKYPEMFKNYQHDCKKKKVQTGKMHIWKDLTGDWIINFPTKTHWKKSSSYEDIETGLVALRKYLIDKGPVSVTLPALGCGHGGLDWNRVKGMIEEYLGDLDAKINVFEPLDSRKVGSAYSDKDTKASEEMLIDQGVKIIQPDMDVFPSTLKGKMTSSLYIKGNEQLLEQPILAFLSSQKPDEKEVDTALAYLDVIARPGLSIMVGYGPHVDRPIIRRALELGSDVIVSFPEGLLNFRIRNDLKDVWDEKRISVMTLAPPKQKWSPQVASKAKYLSLSFANAALITDKDPKWLSRSMKSMKVDIPFFYVNYGDQESELSKSLKSVNARLLGDSTQADSSHVVPLFESLGVNRQNSLHSTTESPTISVSTEKIDKPFTEVSSEMTYEKESSYTSLAKLVEENNMHTKNMTSYPKRLIEVDLPIKKISAHARREKSIRHGHISTMHIWWARRPLASCRAVLCAALWPDPADPLCPPEFKQKAAVLMQNFWDPMGVMDKDYDDAIQLRQSLLDFIADFANWDNSTKKEYLETSRALTQTAHEALGGIPGTRPLVVDPFAGGGAIPLEALRVGADAFASDLNPVAVLLNKVLLEYIPRYGQQLADEVRKWGKWIKEEAEKELAQFYPKDPDGTIPIAYLWARTVQCEGPRCGAEVPLMRSLWLAKKKNHSIALRVIPNPQEKRVDFELIENAKTQDVADGTVKRGSATCPCCGFTTPVASVRKQLKAREGGAADARMFAVVVEGQKRRFYRLPNKFDLESVKKAKGELIKRQQMNSQSFVDCPQEEIPLMSGVFNVPLYGHSTWCTLFTPRQSLLLTTFARIVRDLPKKLMNEKNLKIPPEILQSILALAVDRQADYSSSICTWVPSGEFIGHTFAQGQSLPMKFDFVEGAPLANGSGNWDGAIDWIARVCDACSKASYKSGTVTIASANCHPLPDDSATFIVTDPPYYNAVPYADLSDFFYVWLKRILGNDHSDLFKEVLAPKDDEICEMAGWDSLRYKHKNKAYFEEKMGLAMAEARRMIVQSGLGIIVFAHKETSGWEAQLQAIVDAGWVMTGSWPIDTEMAARLRARNSAALASSIHIVCRPRDSKYNIGDWRDVLQELPGRIHEWMPRLAEEGIVGADAIFACLGPALEIFSRYSHVEKASGEQVTLHEYLEHVWAAVSKEALNMIFKGANTSGFEEDARLTAMWLWTLSTGANGDEKSANIDDNVSVSSSGGSGGFVLEYDAARKIAQGLGAHLENLTHLVNVKGDKAWLLSVGERTQYLFGKEVGQKPKGKKEKGKQLTLSNLLRESEEEYGDVEDLSAPQAGNTVLDRLHQAMLLFAAGRSDALKRFLVEDGAGQDEQFWGLAQAMSALYPANTSEKRWVDGVLARKKGMGF